MAKTKGVWEAAVAMVTAEFPAAKDLDRGMALHVMAYRLDNAQASLTADMRRLSERLADAARDVEAGRVYGTTPLDSSAVQDVHRAVATYQALESVIGDVAETVAPGLAKKLILTVREIRAAPSAVCRR